MSSTNDDKKISNKSQSKKKANNDSSKMTTQREDKYRVQAPGPADKSASASGLNTGSARPAGTASRAQAELPLRGPLESTSRKQKGPGDRVTLPHPSVTKLSGSVPEIARSKGQANTSSNPDTPALRSTASSEGSFESDVDVEKHLQLLQRSFRELNIFLEASTLPPSTRPTRVNTTKRPKTTAFVSMTGEMTLRVDPAFEQQVMTDMKKMRRLLVAASRFANDWADVSNSAPTEFYEQVRAATRKEVVVQQYNMWRESKEESLDIMPSKDHQGEDSKDGKPCPPMTPEQHILYLCRLRGQAPNWFELLCIRDTRNRGLASSVEYCADNNEYSDWDPELKKFIKAYVKAMA